MPAIILVLDFGGTKLSAATFDTGRQGWLGQLSQPSPPGASKQTDMAAIQQLAHRLLAGATPQAVGVSFGGPVDFPGGIVRRSDHVPGWENVPLRRLLQDEFAAPVAVDNDANVAALGEATFGRGRGLAHLCYVTVSTGVGSGWILDGRPWRGVDGMAGEIGHMVVDPAGPPCLCGKRGCVERFASGPYMAADVRAALEAQPEQGMLLRQMAGDDLSRLNGRLVAEAAAAGDPLARRRLLQGAWALGLALGNAANLLNVPTFILGGGVTRSGGAWWEAVRRTARQTALADVALEIVPASLGEDQAPLWGAVALAQALLAGRQAGRVSKLAPQENAP